MEPGDPFANFSFEPSRSQGRFRAFTRPRSKYKYMSANTSSRDKMTRTGSSTSIASITGSTQNLVDPLKVMSMQDEARSKKISTEVMKNRLYESVVTSPRKRRFSMRMDFSSAASSEAPDPQAYARMVQSLPVTPAHSQNVSPAHSPTTSRRFLFGFFSRGATPHCVTPEEMEEEENALMECEEDSWKGLASLFKPQPRYIPGAKYPPPVEDEAMDCEQSEQHRPPTEGLMGPPPPPGIMFRSLSSRTNNTSTHMERPS